MRPLHAYHQETDTRPLLHARHATTDVARVDIHSLDNYVLILVIHTAKKLAVESCGSGLGSKTE